MTDTPCSDVAKPVLAVAESADGLEYCVAIDRPGGRSVLISFFGNREDAERWIESAGRQWHRLASSAVAWKKAA
jgi:threonine dehydrogenase-like Zn-dependent dehydrogenase